MAQRPALIIGVETGGTKVVCASARADDPGTILDRVSFPTTGPAETLARIVEFAARPGIAAVGVGSFGPVDVDPASPSYGFVTSTPKPGWQNTDVIGTLHRALGVPVAITTDVNGAALGEQRWGAGVGATDLAYVTVGTGVGAGIISGGRRLAGSGFPEIAHVPVSRHPDDTFPGRCPFHGDCLEGMACGPAISERWGADASSLDPERRVLARDIEAHYLAQLVAVLAYTLGTSTVILGGGVSKTPGLHAAVIAAVQRFIGPPDANGSGRPQPVIVEPALGDDAGIRGALAVAAELLG
jgi:fructokinase